MWTPFRYSINIISWWFYDVCTGFCMVFGFGISDSGILHWDLCILHLEQCILHSWLCAVLPGYEICTKRRDDCCCIFMTLWQFRMWLWWFSGNPKVRWCSRKSTVAPHPPRSARFPPRKFRSVNHGADQLTTSTSPTSDLRSEDKSKAAPGDPRWIFRYGGERPFGVYKKILKRCNVCFC